MPDPNSAESPTPPNTESMTTSISDAFAALSRGELTEASSQLLMNVLLPASLALVALVIAYFVSKLLARWVSSAVEARVDQTLGRFFGKFTYYAIMTLTVLAILQSVGVGITMFAAALGAVAFSIGLAFQGTLSNFASGILLLVFRPFKVGDVVNAAGVLGKVNEIDLFTTTFDTPDNRRLIVPNSAISGATIENISYHAERRVDVEIGVGYAASLDTTRYVLQSSVEALADYMIEGEGRGYQIVLANLGASSVDWVVRFWAASEDYFTVKEALTYEIKQQLDASGIEIPFPQMQIHVSNEEATSVPGIQAHAASNAIRPHLAEQALPIPKMNVTGNQDRSGKIRPRARGTSSNG